jgi:hypothetical protein
MSIHIKNGTPLDGPPLCDSCAEAHIERGYKQNELLVLCGATYPMHRVRFPVRDCTGYRSKTRESLYEMRKVAWNLTSRGAKRAGFVAPAEPGAETEEIEFTIDPA